MSEDCQRFSEDNRELPKTSEEVPKMFRSYIQCIIDIIIVNNYCNYYDFQGLSRSLYSKTTFVLKDQTIVFVVTFALSYLSRSVADTYKCETNT